MKSYDEKLNAKVFERFVSLKEGYLGIVFMRSWMGKQEGQGNKWDQKFTVIFL